MSNVQIPVVIRILHYSFRMMHLFPHHTFNEQSNEFFLSFSLRYLIANVKGYCLILTIQNTLYMCLAKQPSVKMAVHKVLCKDVSFLRAASMPYAFGCFSTLAQGLKHWTRAYPIYQYHYLYALYQRHFYNGLYEWNQLEYSN